MKFDLSRIERSKIDLKTNINIPLTLTKELAEFIGIIIGDGHLEFYAGYEKTGRKYVEYQIRIAGNKKEKDYLDYIRNLFYSLFNTNLKYMDDKRSNAFILRKNSKGILQFLNKICGIPFNKKVDIVRIPEVIKKSDINIRRAFLRGLADTDYSISFKNRTQKGHNYPVIKGSFKSKKLIEDLSILYKELEFIYCVYYDERKFDKRKNDYDIIHNIYLNGKRNLNKWIQEIGSSNHKFQRKIKKWQEDGICPPGYE